MAEGKEEPSGPWKSGLQTVITRLKVTCPMAQHWIPFPASWTTCASSSSNKRHNTYLSPKHLGTILKVWALSFHRLGNSVAKDAG